MPLSALAVVAALILQAEAPPLQRFAGSWSGHGSWLGKPATASADWQAVLGGRFLRLEYRVTPEGAAAPAFEGAAYWPLPSGSSGTWFDSQGNVHPLALEATADAVNVTWGPPDEPRGRTLYRLLGAGRLQIVDEVRAKEGWREFANMTYEKK
jgi:hypothetical protein